MSVIIYPKKEHRACLTPESCDSNKEFLKQKRVSTRIVNRQGIVMFALQKAEWDQYESLMSSILFAPRFMVGYDPNFRTFGGYWKIRSETEGGTNNCVESLQFTENGVGNGTFGRAGIWSNYGHYYPNRYNETLPKTVWIEGFLELKFWGTTRESLMEILQGSVHHADVGEHEEVDHQIRENEIPILDNTMAQAARLFNTYFTTRMPHVPKVDVHSKMTKYQSYVTFWLRAGYGALDPAMPGNWEVVETEEVSLGMIDGLPHWNTIYSGSARMVDYDEDMMTFVIPVCPVKLLPGQSLYLDFRICDGNAECMINFDGRMW